MYVPKWEKLADALDRLLLDGRNESEAKVDLSNAIADREIEVRAHCTNGWVLDGSAINVPKRLSPEDFDWRQSRPRKEWRRIATVADHYWDRKLTINVSLIELRRQDVTDILCPATGIGASAAAVKKGDKDTPPQGAESADRMVLAYQSGVQGRPSSINLIARELERRRTAGEVQPTMTAESDALAAWHAQNNPEAPKASAKAIANSLRSKLREAVTEANARKERPK